MRTNNINFHNNYFNSPFNSNYNTQTAKKNVFDNFQSQSEIKSTTQVVPPSSKNNKYMYAGLCTVLAIITSIVIKNKIAEHKLGSYRKELAKDLSVEMKTLIKPSKLKNIISGKELLNELKSLKKENFEATKENIKTGTFLADLHSHSLYSDGNADIETILNQLVQYADNSHKKTGKKFIFALTDHDTVDGAKEALKIIAGNSKKFNNIKFVIGSELSYVHKADKDPNKLGISEVLAYGFNPFKKEISGFFAEIQQKRENLIKDFISDLNNMFGYADFSFQEFKEIYASPKNNWIMTVPWKVHDYGQTKNAIAGLANAQNKDKTALYKELMSKVPQDKKALHHLRELGLVPNSYGNDTRITDLCQCKYRPNYNDKNINYIGQNSFDDIVKVFGTGEDTFFALAHPYFFTEKSSNPQEIIKDIITRSNGYLKASESHHQAYPQGINKKSIDDFNKNIQELFNLTELGGRDNHESNWL